MERKKPTQKSTVRALDLLRVLDSDARIAGHHRLPAVRAHLLEMAGHHQAAIKHYRIAADRATSLPERNYLITQGARLSETTLCTEGKIQGDDQ